MRTGEALTLLWRLQTDGSQSVREVRRTRAEYVKAVRAMETAGQRVLTVLSSPVRGRLGFLGSLGISAARQALRSFATGEIKLATDAQKGLAAASSQVELAVGAATAATALGATKAARYAKDIVSAGQALKFTRAEVDLFAAALARAGSVTPGRADLELRGTFKRLGVDRAKGRSDPSAALGQFAQAFNRIDDAEDRAALAAEVFGKNVGKILPTLEAGRTSLVGLEGAAGGAARSLGSAGAAAGSAGLAIGGAVVLVVAAAAAYAALVAVGIKAAASASKVGEEIYRASERTGVGAEKLSVYRLAAQEANITFDTFGIGLTRFRQRTVDAAEGNKKLADTFKRMGVDVKEAVQNPEKAFDTFVKNFAASAEGAKKTQIAIELFGESGAKMIPVLNRLGKEYEAIKARAVELGVVLTDQEAKALHETDLAIKELSASGAGLALILGKEAAPAVTELLRTLAGLMREGQPVARFIGRLSGVVIRDLTTRVMQAVSAIATIPTAIRETVGVIAVGVAALTNYGTAAAKVAEAVILAQSGDFAGAGGKLIDAAAAQAEAAVNATLKQLKQGGTDIAKAYAETYASLLRKAPDLKEPGERDVGTRDAGARERKKREEAERRARLLDAKTELEAKERLFEEETKKLDAAFSDRQVSEKRRHDASIRNSRGLLEARLVELAARKKILESEDKLEVEKAAERRALAEEEKQLRSKQRAEESEIDRKYFTEEIERLKEHKANLLSLLGDQSQRLVAAYEQAAEQRVITATAAATKINKLEADQLARRFRDAQEQLRLAGENLVERQAAQAELDKLNEEELGVISRQNRRVDVARQEDMRRERAAAEEKRRVEEDLVSARARSRGLDLEEMRRAGASRLEMIRAQLDHDLALLRTEKRYADERLRDERAAAVESVRGTEDYLQKKAEIEALYRERELLSDAEFERRRRAIEAESRRETERADPTSSRSLFGDVFADDLSRTGSTLSALGSLAVDIFGQMGDAAGNMTEMVTGAFGSFAQGIGGMVENIVLYGTAGPNALRKLAAATLASFAAQAIVKSIFAVAEGFGYLAKASAAAANPATVWQVPLYKAAAVSSFKSAAVFGLLGAGAAGLGRAIAGNSFSAGGAVGGGGGGAAGAGGGADTSSQDRFTRDGRASGGQSGGGQGTIFERVAGRIEDALRQSSAAAQDMAAAARHIRGIPAGEVLERAVNENPDAFNTGLSRAADRDPTVLKETLRKAGAG